MLQFLACAKMIPYGDLSLVMLLIFAFAEDLTALVKDFSKSGLKVYVVNVKNSNFSMREINFIVAS